MSLFKKIFIASDHAGVDFKQSLTQHLIDIGLDFEDLGPFEVSSVDYPDYAQAVCQKILNVPEAAGILICGSGVGMCITANRFKGIRAAVCYDEGHTARLARQHNNINVLCLGARQTSPDDARASLHAFLTTPFQAGRHLRRLEKIDAIKDERDPT